MVLSVVTLLGILAFAPNPAHAQDLGITQGSFIGYDDLTKELNAIDNSSEKVSMISAGKTVQGRDIWLMIISEPGIASVGEVGNRTVTMFNVRQHGNEPAGTDASLGFLKYLASSIDAAHFLENQVVLVIPMSNPDGAEANTRENANAIDINRDHMSLETPEATAIQNVVLEWKPAVFIDNHEYGGIGIPYLPVQFYNYDLTTMYANNPNTDPGIKAGSLEMMYNWIWPAIKDAGYTVGEYGKITTIGDYEIDMAGGPDPGISRSHFGLHNCLSMLAESETLISSAYLDGGARRVAVQGIVMNATLRFAHENSGLLKLIVENADKSATRKGANMEGEIYLDNETIPAPWGYVIPASASSVIDNLQKHGIELEILNDAMEIDGGSFEPGSALVKLGQPKRALIPLILEKGSSRNQLNGAEVFKITSPLEGYVGSEDEESAQSVPGLDFAPVAAGLLCAIALLRKRRNCIK